MNHQLINKLINQFWHYSSIVIDSWTTTSLSTAITAFSEVICKSSSDFSGTICKSSSKLTVTYLPSEVVNWISSSCLAFLIIWTPVDPKPSFPRLVLPNKCWSDPHGILH